MTGPSIPILFGKPEVQDLRVSFLSSHLVWLQRDPSRKVLNFYHCTLEEEKKDIITTRQLTYFDDHDAAVHFVFSGDEKYILFLREPVPGKEMYHLYSFDLHGMLLEEGKEGRRWDDFIIDRTPDPLMTCCIGFVGGIQLWSSELAPDEVLLATGYGALFWNLSKLHLSSNILEVVEKHPLCVFDGSGSASRLNKIVSISKIVLKTCLSLLLSCLTYLILGRTTMVESPKLPVEWFVDCNTWSVRGCVDVSFQFPTRDTSRAIRANTQESNGSTHRYYFWKRKPQLHCSFSVLRKRPDDEKEWITLGNKVCFDDLNLQLIGAAGGTGLVRMDFRDGIEESFVDVHLCRIDHDKTCFETYSLNTGSFVERLQQSQEHHTRRETETDITGFLSDPNTGRALALIYEYDKPQTVFIQRDPVSEEIFSSRTDPITTNVDGCGNDNNKPITFTEVDVSFINRKLRSGEDPYWKVVSTDSIGSVVVIYMYSARGIKTCANTPDGYFIYRRRRSEDAVNVRNISLFHRVPRPRLCDFLLGNMCAFDMISPRDGLKIPCFLTIPPISSVVPSKDGNIPLVVYPHGGPNARDSWGYNPPVQLLATRGIAVLQVNYRGSTGYGQAFQAKGMDGEFCRGMQYDIHDAVRYILQCRNIMSFASDQVSKGSNKPVPQSIILRINPQKVAIIGGSFGGYSTMFALCDLGKSDVGGESSNRSSLSDVHKTNITLERNANEHDTFSYCCGVSYVGLYEVGKLFLDKPCFRGDLLVKQYFRKVFGEKCCESELESRRVSPLYNGNAVKVPTLMMHGEEDPRCPFLCAKQLGQSIVSSELWAFSKEGHGFKREPNRILMWYLIEGFLLEHLFGKNRCPEDELLLAEEVQGHTARRIL